jgi:medium-chain acyl-[acyl-carrier-protein] hydrolase
MAQVYTESVTVRHDELDAWGRVRVSALLRWLAQGAADASTAAGFGPQWYDDNGLMWLVRRTLLDVAQPLGRSARVTLRTWVEDFRRVRSHRAYELANPAGALLARGRTDWVLIDTARGRPVRVPPAVEEAFGVPAGSAAAERPPWRAPAPPEGASRMELDVRFADLDSLAHVNNATYLDLLTEGMLGTLGRAGWDLDRMRTRDLAPWVRRVDVEYLDAAVYGDRLASTTWVADATPELAVYQLLGRTSDGTPLVRARTDWAWMTAAAASPVPVPADLLGALAPVRAA